jgi:hypothetical protein
MITGMGNPHTQLGDLIRTALKCPMCTQGAEGMGGMLATFAPVTMRPTTKPLRIVAYRPKSIRIECRTCGLRFSIDPENFADTVARSESPPPETIERRVRQETADSPGDYLTALHKAQQAFEHRTRRRRNEIVGWHRQGVEAAAPRKGAIRFPARTKPQEAQR